MAAPCEEREATMPKSTQMPYRFLHKDLLEIQSFQLCFAFHLQNSEFQEWTRRDSNS